MAKELVYIDRQNLVDAADALRERLSTTDTYSVSEFADAIQEIQGGIDTSDADATAMDMVYGKSAYVNGEKVNGALPRANGEVALGNVSNAWVRDAELSMGDSEIILTAYVKYRAYLDENRNFYLGLSPSLFGEVQSSSVLAGETFTSSAGFKEEGTLVVNKYYTGSSEPSSSLGNNGDLYLMVSTSSDEVEEDSPLAP